MRECFVIMPIGSGDEYERNRSRFEQLIKPAVEGIRDHGQQAFRCVRSDLIVQSGSITLEMLNRLYQADVVIADISNLNANVLYELGVRHALRTGTILIAEKGTSLPFDIRQLRVIMFDGESKRDAEVIRQIRTTLKAALSQIVEDSPVFDAIPELRQRHAKVTRTPSVAEDAKWTRLDNGAINSPLDGWWLERIDRRGEKHYSIFKFNYLANGHLHPFAMAGHSFRPDGSIHSRWETEYIRVEVSNRSVAVEYIYSATMPKEEPKRGYGISRFWSDGGDEPTAGQGYYLAGEEPMPYRCDYELHRINDELRMQIGAARESLQSKDAMIRFVMSAHKFYERSISASGD